MTCHREENAGNDKTLTEILEAMDSLPYPTIYPELKSKVVGYNSLPLTIINIVKDIDALLSYVADETLKTGSISE